MLIKHKIQKYYGIQIISSFVYKETKIFFLKEYINVIRYGHSII